MTEILQLQKTVIKHGDEILELAKNVSRVVAVVEKIEEQRKTDIETVRDAVKGIQTINERMGSYVGIEKELSACREDIRGIKHDLDNVLKQQQELPQLRNEVSALKAEVAALTTKTETLESWQDKVEGAKGAISVIASIFWTLFGGIITAATYFFFKAYFTGGVDATVTAITN